MGKKNYRIMKKTFLLLAILFTAILAYAQQGSRQLISVEQQVQGILVNTSDGQIRITPFSQHALEVEFVAPGAENPPSYALAAAPPAKLKTSLAENSLFYTFATEGIAVQISKDPFHISYYYKERPLFSEASGYFDAGDKKGFRFFLAHGEKLMGGGERVLGMDRRGKRLRLYNNPSYGYETYADLMYYSLPVVISSNKYMLAFDNGANGYLDLGVAEHDVLRFEAEGGRMSYLVVAADHWDQLASGFTALTGRQPLTPRWALGNISSRMGYHSQQEVEGVVEKFIADSIPLDAIVLDLFWFGKEVKGTLGNLEWHTDSFPEPEKMMAGLKEKGVKTVLITEPFILRNTLKYPEVIEQGLVATDTSGQPYHYDFYFGNTTLLDIFKPETRDWFWNIYKKHTLSGVDGWWGDLGEPERHPDDIIHVNGRGDEVHNLYGHVWAQTIFDGYAKDFPTQRPVILMRSGFIGSQRYGLIPWSGDVNRSWGGLKPQVEIALSMSLQGLAYMHSDLGGFAGDYEDAELYTRWLQYGVFQPVFRTHAQEDVPAEPVFWDEATKDIVRRYIKLRYQLLPYNYTLAHKNTAEGVPMMRPLFYVDDNPDLLDNTTTYLWGDHFLVSPVTEKGAATQKVYFPKNARWFDFWTGEAYEGGQEVEVPVDIHNIPVFVKAGAFIPMVPEMQHTKDYSSAHLILHYYHDESVASSEGYMYEDDGETKNGGYELIRFKAQNGKTFRIDIRSDGGEYAGKPEVRTVELVIHNLKAQPEKFRIKAKSAETQWDEQAGTFTVKASLKKGIKATFN